ncbi:MAG: hypothetical protein ACIALR_10300 [Blastopirellula sp. JB062]
MKHLIAWIGSLSLAMAATAQELPKATQPSESALRRTSPRRAYLYGSLYSGVSRRPAIDQYLLDQGLDSAGKLPIVPYRRWDDAIAPNRMPLPTDKYRGVSQPKTGLERYYRSSRPLPRLTPTQRAEAPLYRGPSRPGMIAPKAEANRSTPNWRQDEKSLRRD